jgi:hypothetical protein
VLVTRRRYLDVRTVEECWEATDRLRERWLVAVRDTDHSNRQHSADGLIWERRARPENGPRFRGVHSNTSALSACLVGAGARVGVVGDPRGFADWGFSSGGTDKPLEHLAAVTSSPPNTHCNLLNFNETAEGCAAHDEDEGGWLYLPQSTSLCTAILTGIHLCDPCSVHAK